MIIQLKREITAGERGEIEQLLKSYRVKAVDVKTQFGEYLVCIFSDEFDLRRVGSMPGVRDVHRITDSYKLVSRQWKVRSTRIDLGDGVVIGRSRGGDNGATIMAGPCSIEGEEQVESVASMLAEKGVRIMRGGVFKPRSSPYSFRGGGIEALRLFSAACKPRGIKIITEVMQLSQIEPMYDYVDIFQVGARNTQNYNLLDALGEAGKPVLLKRGLSGTIDELLHSAEYIFSAGNEQLMLCERGIRTFETAYRNTFDINAIPLLKTKSHLPVIADPSHGTGMREYVIPVALAALVAGADGLLVEVHPEPEVAHSDGRQTLNYGEFERLLAGAR